MRVILYSEIKQSPLYSNSANPYWFFEDTDRKWFVTKSFEDIKVFSNTNLPIVSNNNSEDYVNFMLKNYEESGLTEESIRTNPYDFRLGYMEGTGTNIHAILKLDIPDDLKYEKEKNRFKLNYKEYKGKNSFEKFREDGRLIIVEDEKADRLKDEKLLKELKVWMSEDNAAAYQSALYRVFIDFKSFVEKNAGSIADLGEKLNYGNGNIPSSADYGKAEIQQYYLLRYGYIYTYNYYSIYRELLKRPFLSSGIRVLSLGCGLKLDGLGMKMALETAGNKLKVHGYRGVDYAAWNAHGYDFWINDNDFYLGDVIDFLKEQEKLEENIFIFPTSISELDSKSVLMDGKTVLDQMLDLMKDKINSEHFCFVATLRK